MRSLLLVLVLAGCPTDRPTDSRPYEPVCDTPTDLLCDIGADLPFHDAVSDGTVVTRIEDNDWIETIDARAGGFLEATNNPWIYVRFGEGGLEKVDLTDLEASQSMDWDLALHRFHLRLNSGTSGPSCVSAAPLTGTYDQLDLPAAQAGTLSTEAFYDASCTFLDEEAQEGAPDGIPLLVLQAWWDYPGCVATNGTPFAIQLASGRLLKAEVLCLLR